MRKPMLFAALIAITVFAHAATAALAAGAVGETAALTVPELDGQTFDLAALRGRVVIVNFWATWCPPCRKEMPALDAVYRRFHPQGLEMLGVSADRPRDRSEVEQVMKSFNYPAAMLDDATSNDFGSPAALPVTYVIGRDGLVRARLTSDQTSITEASLTAIVAPLLDAKAPARAH
jgi:thiol-disulfide isomerase/thioredoxin